jgi:hypothetical protein
MTRDPASARSTLCAKSALLGVLVATAFAQSSAQAVARGDTAPLIVRGVELRRSTVFDSSEARFWPFRVANALHAVTRRYVVRRELLLAPGDPYDTARVRESERNLRALGIFRDVVIDSVVTDSGLVVRVRTADAWTTTPSFDLSTSGTQSVLSLAIQESNLLGTRTAAAVSYENDPDRSSIAAGFDAPRAIASRIGVGASYVDRSDGRGAVASIRYPFVSLSSRHGASVSGQFSQGRVLRFIEGQIRPELAQHREFSIVRMDMATAPVAGPRGFVRVGVAGQVRREDFAFDTSTARIPNTVTEALGPYVEVRAPRYIRVRNVQGMERIEDVDLGFRLRAGVLVAPRAWGYERDGIGRSFSIGIGRRIPAGFIQLDAGASGLHDRNGVDSSSVSAGGILVMQPVERMLLTGHVAAGQETNPRPGSEYDLGFGRGVRAYPAHAFTGDRVFLMNAECRWIVWPRLAGLVGVGVAAFADHAGAWYAGSARRTGTDAGIGLRLASIREAGNVWRLDLAHRAATDVNVAKWVVSTGRGFVF